MCSCVEARGCDVCGSFVRVCEYQGSVLCEECLTKGVNYEAS